MPDAAASELTTRLRDAGGEELLELLEHHAAEIGVREAGLILRNPFCGREVIERLLEMPSLLTAYEIRRELATHPQTPEVRALRLVGGLYWRDLMRVGLDSRVRPTVRRAADRQLHARLGGLAAGEKIALARRAGPGVLSELRRDPDPRVIRAMLENPRLTEGVLMPLVLGETTPPKVLEAIAADRRWGVRYEVRRGLASNPRTPLDTALRTLPHLKKVDLRQISRDRKLHPALRRRARLLLGEGP